MSYCEVLKTRLPLPANVPRAVIFLREVVKNGCTGRRNLQRRSSCKAVGALDVPLKRDRGGQRGKLKSDEVKWSNTREKKKEAATPRMNSLEYGHSKRTTPNSEREGPPLPLHAERGVKRLSPTSRVRHSLTSRKAGLARNVFISLVSVVHRCAWSSLLFLSLRQGRN